MLTLVGLYRDGWRRPVEAVELWHGLKLLATLPGPILAQLVAHHVEGLVLEQTVRRELRLPTATAVSGGSQRERRRTVIRT